MIRSHNNPWLHRYAIFVACSTFILIIAGALVTSNDAGLSVPDWPTTFGSFRMPAMVGGVLYEHSHRMIAGTVAILTMILAVWLWLKESRSWVRWLGVAAVLVVVAQAVLGGITVLFYLPAFVSTSHATLAQVFFCLTFSLSLFTSAGWRWDEPKIDDSGTPSLRHLTVLTTSAILAQLILGAAFRHSGFGIAPHIVAACLVILLLAWVEVRILRKFSERLGILRPALLLMGLLLVQVFLGIKSYMAKLAARDAPQPLPRLVDITTAHVAVGALTLVASLYLTYQAYRYLAIQRADLKMVSAAQKATT